MKIDFDLKDTEYGWTQRFDQFILKAIPEWFNWLSWVFILGGLHYLSAKSKNNFLVIILVFTYGALLSYFNAIFYKLEFINFPFFKKYKKIEIIVSLLISGLLSFGFWRLSQYFAILICEFTK